MQVRKLGSLWWSNTWCNDPLHYMKFWLQGGELTKDDDLEQVLICDTVEDDWHLKGQPNHILKSK